MAGQGILNRTQRRIHSSHLSEKGHATGSEQVVLETITITLTVLSLTLNVMFNSSLFKVIPLAVRVVKRQMNVLSNNYWEICGSLAKH